MFVCKRGSSKRHRIAAQWRSPACLLSARCLPSRAKCNYFAVCSHWQHSWGNVGIQNELSRINYLTFLVVWVTSIIILQCGLVGANGSIVHWHFGFVIADLVLIFCDRWCPILILKWLTSDNSKSSQPSPGPFIRSLMIIIMTAYSFYVQSYSFGQ